MDFKHYYGFNFQWMFSKDRRITDADRQALDFMQDVGLNFVRMPTDYRLWTKDTDYLHPEMEVIDKLVVYFRECEKRKLHFCLNLHRAPGYCINNNQLEKDNLWLDKRAQDGFVFLWELFAKLFKGISAASVSFNLVNEPPAEGEFGFTRSGHKQLVARTLDAIRAIDPARPVIVDGVGGGHLAMPELADLPVIQSVRGYQPMALTHFRAPWCAATRDVTGTCYPGTDWDGQLWDKQTLAAFYRPWLDLQQRGVAVHVGEFGCFNQVPNEDALRWFSDLLGLFKQWGWGYALWGFAGSFGIVNHGRPGTVYEEYRGFKVDKKLLDIYLENRNS